VFSAESFGQPVGQKIGITIKHLPIKNYIQYHMLTQAYGHGNPAQTQFKDTDARPKDKD